MARKYLLSIDGGGLRGILPVMALIKLEEITRRPARETFSFVAGTSTGALIAAGLAAGIPARTLLDLYGHRAQEIFARSPLATLQRIVSGSMYSTERLHKVIGDALGSARDWTLNDSPIDLLITAKRLSDGAPWYFVRDNPRNSRRTGGLKLVDCATASAAEPTYFQPWTMPEDPARTPSGASPIGELVGGGVGVAGNPVYQACVEAFFYNDKYRPEETVVVSLGTGRDLARARPTWIGDWLAWVLSELLRSPGEQQTELVQRHFSQMPFYRIDTRLERDYELDDMRSIGDLQRIGARLAEQINWPAIFAGTDTTFLIGKKNTLPAAYARSVETPA